MAHSRGDLKRHEKYSLHLLSLRWGCAPAQPTGLSPQNITVMHKSQVTPNLVSPTQQEHSHVLPVPMGDGISLPRWPWHFSGKQDRHTAL